MNLTKILGYKVPIPPFIIHPICTIVLAVAWLFAIVWTISHDSMVYQRPAYVTAIDHYQSYDIVTIDTLSSQYQKETTPKKYKKGQRIYVPNYDTELNDMLAREHGDLLWQFFIGFICIGVCFGYLDYRNTNSTNRN